MARTSPAPAGTALAGQGKAVPVVRCAVYTRKSSEEGLEQTFNSLHAQRDVCEAYIASQKGEGWVALPTVYDDGGHSGGTMDRPALKALLADVAAGQVDTVVVYKVDRLSRALTDFARMVDLFDAHGCAFVSVTQAFSTTTSMGRLTLDMLLSFAQFEREVTGERISDKIAASKAKGMWMGGVVPLGYQADGRTLKVVPSEAGQVRTLFDLYLHHHSVDTVVGHAADAGIRSKARQRRDGRPMGGAPLGRAAVYRILANRLYLGEIAHKGQVHPGLHDGIVAPATFDAAQALLADQRRKRAGQGGGGQPALLTGRLFTAAGERLTPTHTRKGAKRYPYYAGGGLRLPQAEVDELVTDTLLDLLTSPTKLAALLPDAQLVTGRLLQAGARLATRLQRGATRTGAVHDLIVKAVIAPTQVTLTLALEPLGLSGMTSTVAIPATVGRDRARLTLVVPGPAKVAPDAALVALVAQARDWFARLTTGQCRSLADLASRDQVSEAYVRQLLPAAFLTPDFVTAIVAGRQPAALTVAKLKELLPLPTDWAEQKIIMERLNNLPLVVGSSYRAKIRH